MSAMAPAIEGRGRVLLADDEQNFRRILSRELASAGYEVVEVGRGDDAIARLSGEPFDVALLDLRMPGAEGLEVLRAARKAGSRAEAIVLTGHGSIESVVEALRLGAFDYLTKPCRLAEVEHLVARAARKARGEPASGAPGAGAVEAGKAGGGPGEGILGTGVERVLAILDRAAPSAAPILLEGESGVGKELLARRAHERSAVAGGPFVVVNCGALAEDLVLSELFGHEKGAFTGAEKKRAGLLDRAAGGTAFFDEVGELPLEAQVRLLRFLQFGEVRPVGADVTHVVKVRVVAATNRPLADEVRAGRFREDLFYRLHTIHVQVPALRDRPGDVRRLAPAFLARTQGGEGRAFDEGALALLERYRWPGNVRELENIVERLAILAEGRAITRAAVVEHFPGISLAGATAPSSGPGSPSRPSPDPDSRDGTAPPSPPPTLRELEEAAVREALHRTGGDKVRAAKELGIALKTLYNKIKAFAIPPVRRGDGP